MFSLPTTLTVKGIEHPIRTDYRDVIRVIQAMNDPELKPEEKVYVCLFIIYEDFEDIDPEDYEAAFSAASLFIDYEEEEREHRAGSVKLVDFEQDEKLIISAINKVAGCEIRSMPYLHWWTFLGYFMEIGECTFLTVLGIRTKRSKHKKLEKWEQEYFDKNRDVCMLREKLTQEEKEDYDRLKSLL